MIVVTKGVMLNGSQQVSVQRSSVDIKLDSTNDKHFKPGFSYRAQVSRFFLSFLRNVMLEMVKYGANTACAFAIRHMREDCEVDQFTDLCKLRGLCTHVHLTP